MSRYLESEAPDDFKLALKRLEDQSDDWFQSLTILKKPWNLGSWGILTGMVQLLERAIGERGNGSADHKAALLNLGFIGPMIIPQLQQHSPPAINILMNFDQELAREAAIAIDVAHKRQSFLYTFPIWHLNLYYAEFVESTRIKFTARGSINERMVSAYQKGFRPLGFVYPPEDPQGTLQASEREWKLLTEAAHSCKASGPVSFFYPRPFLLLESLHKKYLDLLVKTARHDLTLSLGQYTMSDFLAFYAALLAVCTVHEQLCHLWSLKHAYPINSGVIVKTRSSWIDICSRFSSIAPEIVDSMITDLTLGTIRPISFQIHPFVPLNLDSALLALCPHFPLNSKPDENILRVCSYLRKDVYDAASLRKEATSREELKALLSDSMSAKGPVNLTAPVPDIDLLISDEASSTLLICELKWIRKPALALENSGRNADFFKGLRQLNQIKTFLTDNPEYLSQVGVIRHKLVHIKHIYYILVARDHFKWIDPETGILLVDYDVFKKAISKAFDLQKTIQELSRFDWLPKEGRDFVVNNEYAISNGVVAECENFYSPDGAANPFPIVL